MQDIAVNQRCSDMRTNKFLLSGRLQQIAYLFSIEAKKSILSGAQHENALPFIIP